MKLGVHQEQLPAAPTYEDELHYVEIDEFKSLEIPSQTKAARNLT